MEHFAIEWQVGLDHPYERTPPKPGGNARAPMPGKEPMGPEGTAQTGEGFFGEDGFTFWDLLDIINPLQHIPVVSTIYRAITGDQIDPGARVLGGALFGGAPGVAVSVANLALKGATGRDLGEHALAAVTEVIDPATADGARDQLAFAPPITPQPSAADVLLTAQASTQNPVQVPAHDQVRDYSEVLAWAQASARQASARQTPSQPSATDVLLAAQAQASTPPPAQVSAQTPVSVQPHAQAWARPIPSSAAPVLASDWFHRSLMGGLDELGDARGRNNPAAT